jgi:hypothetical protein
MKRTGYIFLFFFLSSACFASDTNWQFPWTIFDANVKTTYHLFNENTLHWHDAKYYTQTQSDANWNKYTLLNADINFNQLQNYPTACPNGYAIRDINDTNFTCIAVGGSGNDTNWQTSWTLFDANLRATFASKSMAKYYSFFDDFDGSTTGNYWTSANSGAGSVQTQIDSVAGENTYGVLAVTKGTTGSGRAALTRGTGSVILGEASTSIITKIKVPTTPGPTQQFNIQLGLHDTTSTDAVDGVYFNYAPKDTGDARINCVTSNNSTRTTTNSGTNMDTAWKIYRIEINSIGTQALFYINETLVCTHTTNIPTGAGRVTSPRIQILNNGGASAESFYVDYWMQKMIFTNTR